MTLSQFPDMVRRPPAAAPGIPLRARGGLLCLFCVLALVWLARDAAIHQGLARYDRAVSLLLHDAATPLHTRWLGWTAALHSTLGVLGMGAVLAVYLRRRGETAWLALWCMVVPAGMLANLALKHLVRRPRPSFDGALPHLANSSFPSGHASGAALFYGFLVLYGLGRAAQAPQRVLLVLGACALTGLVAFSRVYLGYHYPSDVAASVVLALGWTGGVLAIAGLPTRHPLSTV